MKNFKRFFIAALQRRSASGAKKSMYKILRRLRRLAVCTAPTKRFTVFIGNQYQTPSGRLFSRHTAPQNGI